MTELVKQLRNEHTTILTLLQKVKKEKLSVKERGAYLSAIKFLINNHLKEEDEELYPKLREMADNQNHIMDTVNEFTVGLSQIGSLITSFFNKNEEELGDLHTNSDFSKIIKLLEIRIAKEEKGLYPVYDENI